MSYHEERRNRGWVVRFCIKCEWAVFDFVAASRRIRKKNKIFFFILK